MRYRFIVAAVAGVLVVSGCSSQRSAQSGTTRSCPAAWKAGWQRLANRIHVPVYCPTWMPNPLDAKFNGDWWNGLSVKRDRSYLVSFLAHDQSGDVHVNFRGYPDRARIPNCTTVIPNGKQTIRGTTPCFADAAGTRKAGAITATVYQVNQDADQWHILLAWHHKGSLYTVSQHVITPYTHRQVVKNLDRLLAGLVLVQPEG